MRNLSDINANECVTIKHIHIPGALGERIMEMGLVAGTEIQVVRNLCGPLLLFVRGYMLSLRREQAINIEVT